MTLNLSKLLPLAAALALVIAAFVYHSVSNDVHEPVKLLAAPASDLTTPDRPQGDGAPSLVPATVVVPPASPLASGVGGGNPGAVPPVASVAEAMPLTPVPQYGPDGMPLKRAVTSSADGQDSGAAPTPGRNWTPEQARVATGERDRIANLQRANEASNPVQGPKPDPGNPLGASKTQSATR